MLAHEIAALAVLLQPHRNAVQRIWDSPAEKARERAPAPRPADRKPVLPDGVRPTLPPKSFIGTAQAAEITGYSVHTIRDAAESGELQGSKRLQNPKARWRFTEADLTAWVGKGAMTGPTG